MLPQKIKKTTLVDQVCQIIKDRIQSGEWALGTKIPSENDLAEGFGVNRLTVRNALQKLNALGIVETRAGEGTFVKQFDLVEYLGEVSGLITSPEMLDGVLEFRRCIEMETARLAVQRVTDEDMEALELAYQRYVEASSDPGSSLEDHINGIVNADLDFHQKICEISKNNLLALSFSAARETMFQYIKSVMVNRFVSYKLGSKSDDATKVALENHRQIMESIKNRDYETFERRYLEMIDYENLE